MFSPVFENTADLPGSRESKYVAYNLDTPVCHEPWEEFV
jgi:hypothetical protein